MSTGLRRIAARVAAVALVLPLALAGAMSPAFAADTSFEVTSFTLTAGATPDASSADPAFRSDPGYTANPAANAVTLRASYRCASDTARCDTASATFVLTSMHLAAAVPVPAPIDADGDGDGDDAATVAYFSDEAATVPAAGWADARAFTLAYTNGIASGIAGELAFTARLDTPSPLGPQSGSVVVTPAPLAATDKPSRVRVSGEFPATVTTSTSLSWAKASFLSGVEAGDDSPTNTATLTSTNTGDPADALTVSWPADPTVRPTGLVVGQLADLTALSVTGWPTGAARVVVTGWQWTSATTAPVLVTIGTFEAGAAGLADVLAGLDAGVRSGLVGLRLVYQASSGSTIAGGASSVVTISVREHGSSGGTPTARSGAVDYTTSGDLSADLNALTVGAAATTTATRGSVTSATSSASASYRVLDPRAYAGSSTTLAALSGGTVYAGGYVLATSTATNWTRRPVASLALTARPTQADIDANDAALNPDIADLDARVFDAGLTFAGFGNGVTGSTPNGLGATTTVTAGYRATLRLVTAGGTTSHTVNLAALPTNPADVGLTSWSQVLGFTVVLDRADGATTAPQGSTLSVPYLLRAGSVSVATTYTDHTLATVTLGSDTSAVSPRTQASGNRPVTAATITVALPSVAVTMAKNVREQRVTTSAGSGATAVLSVTSAAGTSGHVPDTLTVEDSARASGGGSTGAAWWNVMRPVAVDTLTGGDVLASVEYYTNTTGQPVWMTFTGSLTALGDTTAWRGMRVVYTRTGGLTFAAGSTQRARVDFVVRDTILNSQAWQVGTTLYNVAQATSSATIEGLPVTSTVIGGRASVVAVGPGAVGESGLAKTLSQTSWVEGNPLTPTATLTWGTADGLYGSVLVADANGLGAGDAVPATGRTGSFWDTFDLTGIAASTATSDPLMAFDQVADIQVYDVPDATWISLKDEEWDGAAWTTLDGTRTDVMFGGSSSTAFPYPGAIPAVSFLAASGVRDRIGGVRLLIEARSQVARASAVPATDWRTALLPTLTTGKVAVSDGPARQISLGLALRTTSRSTGALVNNAFAYTESGPGTLLNGGRVTGYADPGATGTPTDLGGPTSPASERTFQLTPATLSTVVTKTWQRTANGSPLTPSQLQTLAIPVGGQSAPESSWPTATLTVTGRSSSDTPVDGLVLSEPSGIAGLVGQSLPATSPFARFTLVDVTTLTATLSGATGTSVTLYRLTGGVVAADAPISAVDALGLTETDLAGVVGLAVAYTGQVTNGTGNAATLTLLTPLRPTNRVTLTPTAQGDSIVNAAAATASDALVCTDETTPTATVIASCTGPRTQTSTASATLTVETASLEAFGTVAVTPADVQRDATNPAVTATLAIQNFGLTDAEELQLVAADARYFNAVSVGAVGVSTLPTGADAARLEVLLAGDLSITAAGQYSGPQTWVPWGTDQVAGGSWNLATLAAAAGATADQVIGVRVRFVDTNGSLLAAPGQGYGQVTLTGALRRTLLTGGLPSATGAEGWTYGSQPEAVTNPAETVRGQVSLRASAVALRTGLDPVTRATADATFPVHAGAATITTTKTELAAASRAPGDYVQYRIRVANTATGTTAGDLTGLVVTDALPGDGSLTFGTAPAGQQTVSVTAAGGGASPLPEPTVTTGDGTVVVTFPADARLAPGAGVDVLVWVRVATELSSTSVVNAARVTSSTRPVEGEAGGSVVGTTCAVGTYQAATSSCAVSAAPLSVGGANVYVSSTWVRDGDGSSDTVRTAGSGACSPRGTGADSAWFRYPCAVVTTAGSTTNWQVQVVSRATVPAGTLQMVDMLPQSGDYPAMASSGTRGSTWRPAWDGAVPTLVGTNPVGATLAVWTTTADYRSGGLPASADFDPVPGTWTLLTAPMSAAAATRVTGFKFVVTYAAADLLGSGESTQVQWSMRTPLTGVSDDTDAWNSFGFRVPADGAGRPADVTSVPLKAGVRYDLPAVVTPTVAVGDRVWRDTDRDGVQDSGESGVEGVIVDLYAGGTWAGGTTTDAQGDYLFDGLPAGTYDLRFTLPAALAASSLLTSRDAGTDDTADSDPDSTGLIASVTLTADETGLMRTVAGMPAAWRAAHPDLTATYVDATRDAGIVWRKVGVGDTVWVDADRDGVQDAGEPGLAGATVRLLGAGDAVLATTTTSSSGAYAFDGLEPGDYRVEVVLSDAQAARYRFTTSGTGADPTADSDVDSTGTSALVTLTPAVGGHMVTSPGGVWSSAAFVDPTLDAGVVERGVSVGDLVWVDLDEDGVQDAGEPGLPGVVLTLTDLAGNPVRDTDGTLVGPATTDADGRYEFAGLLPGTYQVHVDSAAVTGYRPTTPGVGAPGTDSATDLATSAALVGGQADPTLDFGFRPLYAVGDLVWHDDDRDGVQDEGEVPFPGVEVTLLDADGAELATTVTDADGRFVFDELAAGTYRLRFVLDEATAGRYEFTTSSSTAGADDSDAVPQDATTALSAPFVLGPATAGVRATTVADGLTAALVDPTWDAGVREIPVQVGDLVWFDADGDGIQDEGEAGLPGVVLRLTTPDGHDVVDADGRTVAPVTTDADGAYAFARLVPGTYVVVVDRVASGSALAGYGPAPSGAGDDRSLDSSTWTATSAALVGGQADPTLDFGLVLADDVQLALDKDAVSRVGGVVTWKVTVLSAGLQDAYAGFSVVDTLPDGLTFVSASGDGFDCSAQGSTITCRYDDALPAGSTASVQVVTRLVRAGVDVRNVAEVTVAGHPYRFQVLAATDTAWSGPTSTERAALARTGTDAQGLVALAGVLLVAGSVLLVARRRRRASIG